MIEQYLGKSYFLVIAIFFGASSLSVFTPLSYGLESSTSLQFLYKFRNLWKKPKVPNNVLIVTPYFDRKFDSPDYLRNYDRRHHASAIDNLVALGADLFAIDLYFRTKRFEQDNVFANSMEVVPNVVLSQLVRPMPVSTRGATGHYLRNPIERLASSATSLAPPMLPATTSRINRVPLFRPILHSDLNHTCFGFAALEESTSDSFGPGRELRSAIVPTFALAVLEQHVLRFFHNSELHRQWLQDNIGIDSHSRSTCQLMATLRSQQNKNGLAGFPSFSSSEEQRKFAQWQKIISEQAVRQRQDSSVVTLHLNFIGPPTSIKTLSYAELETYAEEVSVGTRQNKFRGSTVFIGGSFNDPEDQKEDGFRTVFTNDDQRMSGVEINATAFHNLINDSALKVVHGWVGLLFNAVAAFYVGIVASRLSMFNFVVVMTFSALLVSSVSLYAFTIYDIWLPAGSMVLSLIVLFTITVVWKYRASSRDRDRAVGHLRSFLSEGIAAQLDSGKNHVVRSAVCIVTDLRNFTEHSRGLEPSELHMTNDAYFTYLFECVSAENVDVVKTYGDSMTAIWTSSDNLASAVRAGIRILESQYRVFDGESAMSLETHIGLYKGDVAIGFVGGETRRTVEVTGNAIYMASRLEQLNKVWGSRFLTTFEVGKAILGCHIRSLGSSKLKGYERPVDVVEIMPFDLHLDNALKEDDIATVRTHQSLGETTVFNS